MSPALSIILSLIPSVTFVVVVIVLIIWIAFSIMAGDSGSSGRKRWKLDNGDEVVEQKGLFGEKTYKSRWGSQEYEKDGDKFREK